MTDSNNEVISNPSVDNMSAEVEEKQEPRMTVAECQVETQKHIENVRKYIRFVIDKLETRGVKHDASKLEPPEVELFAEMTPKLAAVTYGSDEYKEALEKLNIILDSLKFMLLFSVQNTKLSLER